MNMKIKVLLADDHMFLRVGLSTLIDNKSDMTVVGEAENGIEAVELTRRLKPDVVIMDLMMPEMSGAEATKVIHGEMPEVKIIVLTSYGTSFEMSQAVANGASCALLKDATSEALITAIRDVHAGKKVIAPHLLKMSEEEAGNARLTDHQLELLTAVTKGLTNHDIARQFGIAHVSVKKQLKTILTFAFITVALSKWRGTCRLHVVKRQTSMEKTKMPLLRILFEEAVVNHEMTVLARLFLSPNKSHKNLRFKNGGFENRRIVSLCAVISQLPTTDYSVEAACLRLAHGDLVHPWPDRDLPHATLYSSVQEQSALRS